MFHAASAHPKSGGAWTQLTMETAERADGTLAREIAAPGEKAADAREKTDIICALGTVRVVPKSFGKALRLMNWRAE